MRIRIRRCKQLLEKILEFERGNTSFLSLENSLWERLWSYRKRQYCMEKKCTDIVL